MNQAFDTAAFLQQAQSGGFATTYVKVEPGEYPSFIKKLDYRTMPKKDKPEETFHVLDMTFVIDDARQKELTGLDEPTARMSVFLDIIDGKLDKSKNKNVALGKVLEALGLNDREGWSFNDLIGRPCIVKVVHAPNEKNREDPYVNVDSVGKVG